METASEEPEKTVKEGAEKTVKEGAEKIVKEGPEKTVKEGAEKTVKEGPEKTVKEEPELGEHLKGVPESVLVSRSSVIYHLELSMCFVLYRGFLKWKRFEWSPPCLKLR